MSSWRTALPSPTQEPAGERPPGHTLLRIRITGVLVQGRDDKVVGTDIFVEASNTAVTLVFLGTFLLVAGLLLVAVLIVRA